MSTFVRLWISPDVFAKLGITKLGTNDAFLKNGAPSFAAV